MFTKETAFLLDFCEPNQNLTVQAESIKTNSNVSFHCHLPNVFDVLI